MESGSESCGGESPERRPNAKFLLFARLDLSRGDAFPMRNSPLIDLTVCENFSMLTRRTPRIETTSWPVTRMYLQFEKSAKTIARLRNRTDYVGESPGTRASDVTFSAMIYSARKRSLQLNPTRRARASLLAFSER